MPPKVGAVDCLVEKDKGRDFFFRERPRNVRTPHAFAKTRHGTPMKKRNRRKGILSLVSIKRSRL